MTPEADRWSSYRHHVGIEASPLVSDHSAYWDLGNTPFERQSNYRALTLEGLSGKTLATLQKHAHGGWPLGGDAFLAQLERHATRRIHPLPKGRPRKAEESVDEDGADSIGHGPDSVHAPT